ncbi:AI-2E family transporter [Pasteurellaceae bacterium 22721_9_1]
MTKRISLTQALVVLAALVVIFAGIKLASEIVVPFLLSLFIAIICSPLIRFMTNRKVPHWLAITGLFLLILLVFFFLIGLINSSVREFSHSMPQYRELLTQRINDIQLVAAKWNIPLTIKREAVLEHFDPNSIMNFVSSLLLNFSNVVSNAFVLILVVVFMLLEAPYAKRKFAIAFSHNLQEQGQEERHLDLVLQSIISYLGIKTTVSLMTGIAVWLLLEIAGVQYSVLWATLSFLFNYIPNIGSVIAAVPIVIQTLLLNGFPTGFGVAIGVIMINVIIGNVIEPKMMGQRLGLSTLVIFLSLLFWGWLLGTVGMLLSVPLTMALKIALESSPSTARYAVLLSDRLPNKYQ